MALHKRILRILGEHKGRYIGIFILIFLGSLAFITAKGFSDNYARLVMGFATQNIQEDLSFSTDRPIADLTTLEQETGTIIEPYRYYDASVPGNLELRLLSPGSRINLPAVTAGEYLSQPGDILLDPYFTSSHGINIGDSVEVGGKTFRVMGTMALPHYIYPLKYINDILPPAGFGIGLVSEKEFQDFPEAETVYAVYFPNRDNINAQTVQLRKQLDDQGYKLSDWVDAGNNKRIRMPWATITGMKTMAVPMPAAMFLLCCLIIGIMIWRMVRADGVIIGTLYAQGYRRRELMRHYMALPLIVGAAGGLLGVLAGLPCIAPIVKYLATSYYVIPMTGVHISVPDILVGVLMPVLFLGAASFLVIRRELKKSAGELMKGDRQKAKVNMLEKHIRLERLPFGVRFQMREQMRSIPRLLFLLLGVTAASVLMLFGFTITHSMNVVFESGSDDMYGYAYEYTFKEIRQDQVHEGATPFNAAKCYPAGRENAEFYLTGIMPDADINLLDQSGNPLPKEQVNITYLLANRLNLRQGDTISMVNKLDGAVYQLRIDGIIQTYAGQFVYLPLDKFNRLTGQPDGSYTGVFSTRELPYSEQELAGTKDLQNIPDAMTELAMPMTMLTVFMTLIAGLMGAIIIYLVTSLMIEESRGTISLFKVFGYRGKEVAGMILNSSTWAVLAGFLLGIPLMLLSAGAMYAYLGEMINMVLPMILSPAYVLVSFLLIFGVFWLTKRLCGRKLAKIPMSEALKAGTE